jgi:hypothetical protein
MSSAAPVVLSVPSILLIVAGLAFVAISPLWGQSRRTSPTSRPQQTVPLWPGARPAATFTPLDDAFLEELSRASFRYFVEQAHPETGLIRDRARADAAPSEGKASIAGSGFALAGWAIAAHRGWVERAEAIERVRRSLRFLAERAPRHRGFFYHFMEMGTGERAWSCELSSIDSALFLTGAIAAREYFQDPEITALVNRLYAETDWKWFLNGGSIVALGWTPEHGFSRYRWSGYSEHMMMPLLGLGSPVPEHAFSPENWRAWSREPVGTYGKWTFLQGPPLFMHQFTHAYFDFRGRRDAFADYYRNSLLATLAQRQMSIDLRAEFPAWGELLWGVTASDSATGYKGWGMPPRTINYNALDGTIVPCAAAGSIPFAPYETLLALRHMRTVHGDRIWGRYGFSDAFNPHTGWVNPDVIGIDVGITLLMAENARTGLIWALFMQAPEVQRAMELAGFLSTSREMSWAESAMLRQLAAQSWTLLADQPLASETVGLQITAALAAQALGLISVEEAARRAEAMITNARRPETETALAYYAAALITARQAYASVAPTANRRFAEIDFGRINLASTQLGSASRLAAFLQIGTGARTADTWASLQRTPESFGPVYVLAPARMEDQFLPGIWMGEDEIITGASAAQLAYAIVLEQRAAGLAGRARSIFATALLLDHFPAEFVDDLVRTPLPEDWITNASPAERAAFVISVANLLVPDCVRRWFQQDPVVQAARSAIPEFAEAAFGEDTSVLSRRQLAGPLHTPPERIAIARTSSTPRDQWDWHTMAGQEFRESAADVWPSDPSLELRFAFTWDEAGLRFHAVAYDTPPGYERPPGRSEVVELYIDPKNDGLIWADPGDLQFVYESRGVLREGFQKAAALGEVRRTTTGYEVEALIPWQTLGVTPGAGVAFGVSPAIVRAGPTEVAPSLKLNWRFYRRLDERIGLATLRLE